jgi:hypothetical protein
MTDNEKRALDRREFLRRGIASAVLGGFLMPGDLADLVTHRLARPLAGLADQGRAFEMLVLGDSIMWGQGLKDEQKFSYRVEQWIRGRLPGIEVHRHVFAHSGAKIKANAEEDAKPPTHGEVPNAYPSITAQLATAQRATFPVHAPLDPRSVALVLLDGGINDFGTKAILNPDPTVGRSWVKQITRERCVDRMKALLPAVATAFPNAKVVITNYFQIVSEKSDMVYLWELLRFWDVIGDGVNLVSDPLRQKMSDQALAFHQESTVGFREAIQETTRQLLASGKRPVPVNVAAPLERVAPPPSRVALAEVPFGPRNAYGAPETFLFHINEPDPAASVRKPMCMSQVPNASPALPNCLLAATGHPNGQGARAYANAITAVLGRWVPEWQSTFGVTATKGTSPVEREPVVLRPPGASRP